MDVHSGLAGSRKQLSKCILLLALRDLQSQAFSVWILWSLSPIKRLVQIN